jgi:hypothetical protein
MEGLLKIYCDGGTKVDATKGKRGRIAVESIFKIETVVRELQRFTGQEY